MSQPEPALTDDEQAFLDLHADRIIPPTSPSRDDVDRPVENVPTEGLL